MPINGSGQQRVTSWLLGLLTGLALAVPPLAYHLENRVMAMLLIILAVVLLVVSIFALRGRRLRLALRSAFSDELTELHQQALVSARRYKSLLDNAGEAIFIIDAASGKLLEVNRKALSLLGYDRDDLATMTGRELVAETELRRFSSFFRRVTHRREAVASGISFRQKNGSTIIGEINANLLDLGEERVIQVMVRDITFRHRAEREIRQRNRELSILNNIVVRAANQNLQLQKVLDISLLDLLALFEAQAGAIHLLAASDGRYTLAAHSGLGDDILPHLDTVTTDTPLLGKLAVNRRHLSVPRLTRRRSSLDAALMDGGFASFAAIPLITRGEMIGMLHLMTTLPRTFSYEEMKLFSTIGNQMAIIIEQARLYQELQNRTDELMGSHALLEENSRQLALSQKQLRSNLSLVEQANADLARLNRMKSHFLGMISHEFRTPLTSVLSGSDFLLETMPGDGTGEWRQVATLIHQGGTRLHEIVSELLKLAQLESRESALNIAPLSLGELLTSVQQGMAPILAKRRQQVQLAPTGHLPAFPGDRTYMEDLFSELLANASKFTPDHGVIIVGARVTTPPELLPKQAAIHPFNPGFPALLKQQCYLEVEVRDTGVGISREEQPRIFDPFHELGDIRHHSTGRDKFQGKGIGLGLAVVKGVVEAHGGLVWIETPQRETPGALPGCSVFVLLPLEENVPLRQASAGTA